jgi:hypothetical protein
MGWRFAGLEVRRFSRIGLAFGFFFPGLTSLISQSLSNRSKTSLLSEQSR